MMIHAVHAETHAVVGGHDGADADGPTDGGHGAPATAHVAEGEDEGDDEPTEDTGETEHAHEGDAHGVAVANRPSDEIGVVLEPE